MTGFKLISTDSLIESLGEEKTNDILSGFSCPLNQDIEEYLKQKAIVFSIQGIAKTHLVFASYREEPVLVGYFTLANKSLFVSDKAKLGSNLRKRMQKFATRIEETKMNVITAPLIAQLGKNFSNGYNRLITGAELLQIACNKIQEIQIAIGGKVAYLECEDKQALVHFYEENGFRAFDERAASDGMKLVQMIRYFSEK